MSKLGHLLLLAAIAFLPQLSAAQSSTAMCTWTPSVSEELPPRSCGSGMAVAGLRCHGGYCDNMSLYCCAYGGTPPAGPSDPIWSPWISEEGPTNSYRRNNFVVGLRCRGAYCDEVSLSYNATQESKKPSTCYSTNYFSEEGPTPYRTCAPGYFVSGLSCRGSYCDDVQLECCQAQEQLNSLPVVTESNACEKVNTVGPGDLRCIGPGGHGSPKTGYTFRMGERIFMYVKFDHLPPGSHVLQYEAIQRKGSVESVGWAQRVEFVNTKEQWAVSYEVDPNNRSLAKWRHNIILDGVPMTSIPYCINCPLE